MYYTHVYTHTVTWNILHFSVLGSFESRSSFSVTWICFFFWSSARNKISKATSVPSTAKFQGSWAVSFNPAAVSWHSIRKCQTRITQQAHGKISPWWSCRFRFWSPEPDWNQRKGSCLRFWGVGKWYSELIQTLCVGSMEKFTMFSLGLIGAWCEGCICCWRDVFRPIDLVQDCLLLVL